MIGKFFLTALSHDRAVVLSSLAFVVVLAWAYLVLVADTGITTMDMGGGRTMAMRPEWTAGYALIVFVMWAVMMVAMMLPSAAPVTLLVATIACRRGGGRANIVMFVCGYLSLWLTFAMVATALQWVLDEADMLSDMMALSSGILSGSVLIAAGVYQWTPLKAACLRQCRSPLDFLLFQWRDGALGALRSGIGHGLFCLGCCWVLMGLLFVGGIMSLAWIAGIALLVLTEKTLSWGGRMSRVIGAGLVAWGALTLAAAAP